MSEFINRPVMNEDEMNKKLDELRHNVGKKLDKWANRLQVSMAFTPKIQRLEGEQWIEDGKRWEIKGGIRQTVSIMGDVRMPWWCPDCKRPMNHRFDRKFFYLRGFCYDCNIEFEAKMRMNGTWDAFEKRMVRENEKAFLRDKIEEHLTYIKEFKEPTVYFEDGRFEVIASKSQFQGTFDELTRDVEFMVARLEVIAEEERLESESTETSNETVKS